MFCHRRLNASVQVAFKRINKTFKIISVKASICNDAWKGSFIIFFSALLVTPTDALLESIQYGVRTKTINQLKVNIIHVTPRFNSFCCIHSVMSQGRWNLLNLSCYITQNVKSIYTLIYDSPRPFSKDQ